MTTLFNRHQLGLTLVNPLDSSISKSIQYHNSISFKYVNYTVVDFDPGTYGLRVAKAADYMSIFIIQFGIFFFQTLH